MFAGVEESAVAIAAEKAGLTAEEVSRAVQAYRRAAERLHDEPDWKAVMHMSGPGFGMAEYEGEGTAVRFQVESWKERDNWQSEKCYVYRRTHYETFGEARTVELFEQQGPGANVVRLAEQAEEA